MRCAVRLATFVASGSRSDICVIHPESGRSRRRRLIGFGLWVQPSSNEKESRDVFAGLWKDRQGELGAGMFSISFCLPNPLQSSGLFDVTAQYFWLAFADSSDAEGTNAEGKNWGGDFPSISVDVVSGLPDVLSQLLRLALGMLCSWDEMRDEREARGCEASR